MKLLDRISSISIRSSNVNLLELPYLLVLFIGTSQSRQNDKSELMFWQYHEDNALDSSLLVLSSRRLERTATFSISSNSDEELVENTSEHSFETESESLSEPNEMSKSRLEVTNEKDVSAPKSKEKIVTIRKRKWQGRAEVKVGFLRKPDESAGFAEIVDFLRGSNLRTLEIRTTIDTIGYTITEASIRDTLQLADATGITMLPNDEIFEGMGQMGYPTDGTFTFWKSFFTPQWRYLVHHLLHWLSSKSGGWDQFGCNIATALICLSTDRVYNFSKLIFDGMVANLKSKTKFLMYPRFLQLILNIQTENKHLYLAVTLTKKIFGNMKRGFRGAPRPLLPAMLLVASTNPNAGQEHHAVTQTQPSSSTLPVPSTSSPPVQSPPPIPASIPTPTPIPETEPAPFEHTFEEPSPVHQHFSPPQEQAHGQMTMDDLLQVVPQLISRIDSLETDLKQTKLTMGNAIVKLVKKVKKLEGFLKRRNMILSDSEEEEPVA
ncbi:hypothetical protein Tco_1123200 [Tanacetum coccineum]|uniref:Uncharacterized protein n=1 Tax=Tanacetum coccineum TaxID=301880 RepID=A0ABQ5J4C3_9ASTR